MLGSTGSIGLHSKTVVTYDQVGCYFFGCVELQSERIRLSKLYLVGVSAGFFSKIRLLVLNI